jgi:glycosyltransferase involved in cell wall biosynthesis
VPSVTAVVPLHNKAPYIERCLRSIQAQSFADFEGVVVDDGSTDHSADVVLRIVRDDPRFRLVVQPNRGAGAARNRGIQEARTGLIAFLDADDEWESGFLEAITDLARQFPESGILATGFRGCSADAPDQQTTLAGASRKLIHDYFHRAKFIDIIWSSASAAPVAVLNAVGGFAEKVPVGEDRDLWGRIALRYPIAHDNRILAVYHKEAMGRVCDLYAHAKPFPLVVRTLRTELARGSVAERQIPDVKAYIDHILMQYAYDLLYQHRRSDLARLLRQEPFYLRHHRVEAMLLRCALLLLPMRVIHALKWKPLRLFRRIRKFCTLIVKPQLAA